MINAETGGYAKFGAAWRWDGVEPAERLAKILVNANTPQPVLRWHAPRSDLGEVRLLEITALGFDGGPVEARYVAPAYDINQPEETPVAALVFVVTAPGSQTLERQIAVFGAGLSNWQLEGLTRVAISPAPPTDRLLLARYLEAWLEIAAAEDGRVLDTGQAPSFWMLNRAAGLAGYSALAAGGVLSQPNPVVIIERVGFLPLSDDKIAITRLLDVIGDGDLDALGAPWRAGLALAAAEAETVGVKSMSARLMSASDQPDGPDPGLGQRIARRNRLWIGQIITRNGLGIGG